mmetsp:Transcript_17289/g.19714  ORF Transcript_17289/g.19714 Transcript_17289/m.19714 type:complete len:204 (-) Transcript_17289:293-904(-)
MIKRNPKSIVLKTASIYNRPGIATPEKRKELLMKQLTFYPKMTIKGGTSKNNPYKVIYEVIVAERRSQLEYYNNSILWSPRFTPTRFKYMFLLPALCVTALLLYIRYIATPKRMLELRRKYGYKFPGLEERGWLDGWIDDEIMEDSVTEWTLKDLEEFDNLTVEEKLDKPKQRISQARAKALHSNLQSKFQEIADRKAEMKSN